MVDWEEIEVLCTPEPEAEPEAEPKGAIKEMFSLIFNNHMLYTSVLKKSKPL